MKSIKEIIIIVVAGVLLVLALLGLAKVLGIDITGQDPTPVESSMDIPIPDVKRLK